MEEEEEREEGEEREGDDEKNFKTAVKLGKYKYNIVSTNYKYLYEQPFP